MGALVLLGLSTLIVLGGVAIVMFAKNLKWFAGAAVVAVGAVIAGVTLLSTSLYTQDPGEAMVLKSFTGEVVGQTTTEGLHFKAPWVSRDSYDIRNQQVIMANGKGDEGQGANGPQITVQDKEGVSANVDITVRYSIDPEAVTDVYKRYGTQDNFIQRFIENDIRAGVRLVPTEYTTIELLTSGRAEAESGITEYLEERWVDAGVRVESVSLQEIRYSKDVKARFDAAQSARIEVEKAQAELDATEVSAQQKIVQAEAEAEANRILTQSLTNEVLSQRYLDTLTNIGKDGNLIVVPQGFDGMLNMQK